MLKAFKFRIYPNKTQKILFAKTFGSVRYFWNKQVETFNSYNKLLDGKSIGNDSSEEINNISSKEILNEGVNYLTSTEIRNSLDWMKEVSAAAIQQKEIDFKEYRNQRFNKNRKKGLGNPKFKKRSNNQSYRLPNQKFKIENSKIRLEKVGWVKIVMDREIPENSKFMSVTISKNPSDQYFASVLVETNIKVFEKTGRSVGIDMGLKEFLVQSDNLIVKNPHYFRNSQTKLARLQKQFSKKVKGGRRYKKLRLKTARLHNQIQNQRLWFLHNESLRLIRDYDTIYIEDLNIQGMVKNPKLSKSISDVSWSKFFQMLNYKSVWYGKEIIKIGRFEASSKTCSCCGWVDANQTLNNRVFICENCGLEIDRDLNAAINIKNFGERIKNNKEALGVDNAIRTLRDEGTNFEEAFKSELVEDGNYHKIL